MTPQERIEEAHGLWEIAITRALAVVTETSPDLSPRAVQALAEERVAFTTWQKVATEAVSIQPPVQRVLAQMRALSFAGPSEVDRAIAAKCDCGQEGIHTSSCRVSVEGVSVRLAAPLNLSLNAKRCDLIQQLIDALVVTMDPSASNTLAIQALADAAAAGFGPTPPSRATAPNNTGAQS